MGTSGYCQGVGNVNYSWKTWLSLDNDTRNHLFEVIVQIIEKCAESITSVKKEDSSIRDRILYFLDNGIEKPYV